MYTILCIIDVKLSNLPTGFPNIQREDVSAGYRDSEDIFLNQLENISGKRQNFDRHLLCPYSFLQNIPTFCRS